ncbi:hypothetical protein GLOIN_2v1485813 [Rhizophagus irregularis DAOM 181602=DAOM 197198]|uniref:Uncharacterized protein n=1 Tax=Rhizophagus irregularis (strain DAOM 181602 / DAOM 197198 / MUCL 43194) TaxID=747089 RepID=A0A2P4P9C2_RHIID|nr:hypothetical protein GLOIN_2v1485813 [Rhizophagus irregularis DAOM 181602=DAOM 197198]POG61988.1 hypothetical protein GLOIN_2v1485813 [Rhizophagus irregularis DAOM 181602=DAOM 197198]|eukprot:XP_025168854.1 hypothetical protein GLOIN_2v1485813 [Rhizophagus irregularis DAOM 181602=DAOM 197198]
MSFTFSSFDMHTDQKCRDNSAKKQQKLSNKQVKKSIKSIYSVKHPQLRNSKKSSSDFSSSSGSDEVDEEIKFNLLSISIKLECKPICKVSSSLHDATHKNLINGNVFMNGGSLNLNDLSSCVPEVAPLKLSEEEYAYYAIKINYSFIVNQLPLEL